MGFFSSFIVRGEPNQNDAEAGNGQFHDPADSLQARRNTVAPVGDQLAQFRFLTGISTSQAMGKRTDSKGRPTPNLGVYPRVVKAERAAHKQYVTYQILINGALGVQLIVAAALTALGASGSNSVHTLVTIFGAINTVIAGFLTFLKGSGLPNRLKYYEVEWRKVREYIEQREREFCHPGCRLDLTSTLNTIQKMYDAVVSDVEANRPETYISINDVKRKTDIVGEAAQTERSESTLVSEKLKGVESKFGNEAKEYAWDLENKTKDAVKDVEKYEQQVTNDARNQIHGYAEQRISQVTEEVRQPLSSSRAMGSSLSAGMGAEIQPANATTS